MSGGLYGESGSCKKFKPCPGQGLIGTVRLWLTCLGVRTYPDTGRKYLHIRRGKTVRLSSNEAAKMFPPQTASYHCVFAVKRRTWGRHLKSNKKSDTLPKQEKCSSKPRKNLKSTKVKNMQAERNRLKQWMVKSPPSQPGAFTQKLPDYLLLRLASLTKMSGSFHQYVAGASALARLFTSGLQCHEISSLFFA